MRLRSAIAAASGVATLMLSMWPLTLTGEAADPRMEPTVVVSTVSTVEAASSFTVRTDLSIAERTELVRDERVALAEEGATSIAQLAERTPCPYASVDESTEATTESTLNSGVSFACPNCVKGIPCGNTCISARYSCHTLGGCAGYGLPVVPVVPESERTPEFSVASQSGYPTVSVGQVTELTLRVSVAHGPSWFDQDVALYVSNPDEAAAGLRGWDPSGLLAYNKGVPLLGTSQEFRLRIQALAPGTYRLRARFVHTRFGRVGPDGVYWDVRVTPSATVARLWEGWHSRWSAQSDYPTMFPGQVSTFWIRFANVGTETWNRGTWGRQVNLALNGDNKEPFRLGMASNWLWDDRLATSVAASVAPGEVAEFRFQVRAPLQPGVYTLNLRPVVDGNTWLEDEGVFWTIVVR